MKQKLILAVEFGPEQFLVEGKKLKKEQVELLHKLMPVSQLVWFKDYTKKKPHQN